METMRRYGAGRLAEIFGDAGRSASIRRCGCSAFTAWPRPPSLTCPRRCNAALEAYAAGVNAFLATRRGALPPEFQLLRLYAGAVATG